MNKLILMCGPPGSGKSTMALQYEADLGYVRISQDKDGKDHLNKFDMALLEKKDIIVDRLNFVKYQRNRYLDLAKQHGYHTTIIVLHESYDTCFKRCIERKDHETIRDESNARSAINMFFSKYERVEDSEADVVIRNWPDGYKLKAIVSDLDGTLCNCEHRQHFVRREKGQKKDWNSFFKGMSEDGINEWCKDILHAANGSNCIVLCSGRPDDYRRTTIEWLAKNNVVYDNLFMRLRNDSRQDNIVKEIILDFEILTRYKPHFFIDDRQQVVDMWRKRGYTCLQCAPGNF